MAAEVGGPGEAGFLKHLRFAGWRGHGELLLGISPGRVGAAFFARLVKDARRFQDLDFYQGESFQLRRVALAAFEHAGRLGAVARRRWELNAPNILLPVQIFDAPLASLFGAGRYGAHHRKLGFEVAQGIDDPKFLARQEWTRDLNQRSMAIEDDRTGIFIESSPLRVCPRDQQRDGEHQSFRPAFLGRHQAASGSPGSLS